MEPPLPLLPPLCTLQRQRLSSSEGGVQERLLPEGLRNDSVVWCLDFFVSSFSSPVKRSCCCLSKLWRGQILSISGCHLLQRGLTVTAVQLAHPDISKNSRWDSQSHMLSLSASFAGFIGDCIHRLHRHPFCRSLLVFIRCSVMTLSRSGMRAMAPRYSLEITCCVPLYISGCCPVTDFISLQKV